LVTPRRFNKGQEEQKTENHKERIMCDQNHPSDKEEVYDNNPACGRALFQVLFPRLWTKLREFSAETT
jgi:hypothetical protein